MITAQNFDRMYEELVTLRYRVRELELTLEKEREVSLRVAIRADQMWIQLQAIREAALGDLCGLEAEVLEPENLDGLRELE
jgi:hypothetical protein